MMKMATHSRVPSVAEILTLALAGALVAAVGHVAYNEARFRLLHLFTWTSRDFIWLSPIGYAVIFLLVAVPVVLASFLLPRVLSHRGVGAVFLALAAWSLLLLAKGLHPVAALFLAVGIGSQLARVVLGDPARGMRMMRRWVVGSAATLAVVSLLSGAGFRLPERWMLARLADAAPGAPNVILVILDTVRAANLEAYGYARPTTPVMSHLADSGVLFEQAIATAPWTAPSHASMMTGLYSSQTKADYLRPMVDSVPTVAEVLRDRGYATGAFMANIGYAGHQVGLARGFARYEDFPLSVQQAMWSTTLLQTGSGRRMLAGVMERSRWKVLSAIRRPDLRIVGINEGTRQSASQITDHFFAWRDGIGERPYLAMLNFMEAHSPYEPPEPFRGMFNGGVSEVDRYDGAIAYMDSIVGSMVRRLEASGEMERTVLIITSDHGEHWGEHGLESHGNSLYLPLLHVPLIVYAPGRTPSGVRVAPIASLRDLAATLAEFGGAAKGTLPGRSLAPMWTMGGGEGASPAIAETMRAINPSPRNLTARGDMKAALDSSWHYIRYGDGVEQLFQWRLDPGELDDRSNSTDGAREVARLRAEIAAALGIAWPPATRAPSSSP